MTKPFNSAFKDAFTALGEPEPCFKQGYATLGEAHDHIRGLIADEDNHPDRKPLINLVPYKCKHRSCKSKPWHVGHAKYPHS